MLQVAADPSGSSLSRYKYLIDRKRKIRFSVLGTMRMGEIQVFQLEWKQKIVVVSTEMTAHLDEQDVEYILYRAPTLDDQAAAYFNVSVWRPTGNMQHLSILRIAAECLVAFGWSYDGLESPDGRYRVSTPQGERSLGSFR